LQLKQAYITTLLGKCSLSVAGKLARGRLERGRLEGGRKGAYGKEELELDSYLKSKRALHKKHFLRDIPSKEK